MEEDSKPATWQELQNLCDLLALSLEENKYTIRATGYTAKMRAGSPKAAAAHIPQDYTIEQAVAWLTKWVEQNSV